MLPKMCGTNSMIRQLFKVNVEIMSAAIKKWWRGEGGGAKLNLCWDFNFLFFKTHLARKLKLVCKHSLLMFKLRWSHTGGEFFLESSSSRVYYFFLNHYIMI